MAEVTGEDKKLSEALAEKERGKLWEAQDAQINAIEKEAQNQRLVGEQQAISAMEAEYSQTASPDFYKKAKELSERYSHIRRVRGDGNCFFRAIFFAQLERVLEDKTELESFAKECHSWTQRLIKLGFNELTTSDFCEVFQDLLTEMKEGKISGVGDLLERWNDDGLSNYYVVFSRLVTSGYLKENAPTYEGFVDGGRTIDEYCKTEVDPMFRECDHLCITSLTQALSIPIRIEYMDRSEAPSGGWHHDFCPDDKKPLLFFLYRPGHYDILYKKQ